jgi:cytoskeletal protein CcmA (bactofilin family)
VICEPLGRVAGCIKAPDAATSASKGGFIDMADAAEERVVDASAPSVIGAGITVTGNIEATDDLQVEGKIMGDVRCATLMLGEQSLIKGSIYATRVRAAGTVEGSIDTGDLAIEASARIKGDVTYDRLRIAAGGIVEGQLKHKASPEEDSETSKLRLVGAPPAPESKPIYIE